jgi:hypothetical protein
MAGEPDDLDAMIEPVVPSRHRWLAGLLAQVAPSVAGGLLAGLDLSWPPWP